MRRRPLLSGLTGLAGVLLVGASAACSGDDPADVDPASGAPDAESSSAALDADEVRDQVTSLLVEYDDVVNQIIADPQVTHDPDGPLVERYLDLFEPDSEFADQALETWRTNADQGVSIKPYDDEHPANLTRLDGDVEIVSDDEVRFPTCSEFRQLVYEGDRVVEGLPFMEQPGESVAVLSDDVWVFRRRDVFTDVPECDTEGPTEGPTEGD
jgi:hypothetical protein